MRTGIAAEKQRLAALEELNDVGNDLLSTFGLSLDNFQTEKDPKTGRVSVCYRDKNGVVHKDGVAE